MGISSTDDSSGVYSSRHTGKNLTGVLLVQVWRIIVGVSRPEKEMPRVLNISAAACRAHSEVPLRISIRYPSGSESYAAESSRTEPCSSLASPSLKTAVCCAALKRWPV